MVSVIIPTYCHAPYLRQRIDSVLAQSYPDFEVVLLDDCSTDGSREVIERYRNHPRIKQIVYNDRNGGSAFAQWRKGFALTQGEYIWIAESDDYADPAFLERCVAELDADPACVLAHTLSRTVDSEGRPFGKVRHAGRPVRRMDGRRFVLRHLLCRNELYNASMAVLREDPALLPPFGTACGRGIRRIPLRRRLVFLDARRIAGPRVHRLRTAQRLPPPRRGHDDAGRTDGRTLRGGVADPACHLFADADGGTGTLGARRQAALPAAQSPPAVRTERSLRTAVEPLVRNLPMRPVAQSVVSNLRGAARQHVFLM